jgi:hypothetical protein
MKWPEAVVLVAVAAGATVVAAIASFDPAPIYTGVLAWGASRTITPASPPSRGPRMLP